MSPGRSTFPHARGPRPAGRSGRAGRAPRPPRRAPRPAGRSGPRPASGVPASAARFADRARAVRRRAWRPRVVAAVVLLVLAGAVALALAGPLLAVRSVQVSGVRGAQARAVSALVDPATGHPLARVDTAALARAVAALPYVDRVDVERSWPSTLTVLVTPRVAVAAVPMPGGVHLVDTHGVAFATAATAPAGVPLVQVDLRTAAAGALEAALAVLHAMPADLRSQVSQVSATSPDDVRLKVGGASVVWGGADQTPLKARILTDLRRTGARSYDVSSPQTPVTR